MTGSLEARSPAQHQVLVTGMQSSAAWTALADRLLPQALARLGDLGIAPLRSEVSVLLVDDMAIQALNRCYRGVDAPTDVLSFSQVEGDGPDWRGFPPEMPVLLGDIVVSVPRMRAQAQDYGHGEARELGFLLVHGLLHLLGYDHQTPEETRAMRAAEEDLLGAAGLTRETGNG
jgi:probable rRNA maturation factor